MSAGLSTCFVIALMFVLWAMIQIPSMPRCPFCGKTREHAKDCSAREGR